MSIFAKCYMCEKVLEKDAFVIATESGSTVFLCKRCEYLVKEIEGVKCDFCSSKNVCVVYLCADISAVFYKDIGIDIMSSGNWLACSECENVIDKKDLDSLVERYTSMFEKYGILGDMREEEKKEAVKSMRSVYEVFFNRYSGKEIYDK